MTLIGDFKATKFDVLVAFSHDSLKWVQRISRKKKTEK